MAPAKKTVSFMTPEGAPDLVRLFSPCCPPEMVVVLSVGHVHEELGSWCRLLQLQADFRLPIMVETRLRATLRIVLGGGRRLARLSNLQY